MQKTTIPLIGNITARDQLISNPLDSTKGQVFFNCEFTPFENPFTGAKSLKVQKREGFSTFAAVAANFSTVDAIFPWWGYNNSQGTYGYYGSETATSNAKIRIPSDAYTYTYASTVSITSVTESKNSSGTPCLLVARSGTDYNMYVAGSGAMVAITVPSGSRGPMITIKGWTFLANQDGKIYNSALNDPTSGYSDFIGADIFPDGLTQLAAFKNYLLAFGPAYMEVFEIVDNTTGSPLRHVPNLSKRIGFLYNSISQHKIIIGDDCLYFVGANPALGVFRLTSSFDIEKISTPYIDDIIQRASGPSFVKWGTRNKLVFNINFDGQDHGLVYDPDLKLWMLWNSVGAIDWKTTGTNALDGSTLVWAQAVIAKVFGIYDGATNIYKDLSAAITRTVITQALDFGSNNNKVINYVKVIGDKATSTSNVSISWSDDDGVTFNTAQTVDLSSINPVLWGCGNTRRRIFKITDVIEGQSRLESLEIGYTEGSN